jgi:uncharacterized protein YkwD
VNTNVTIAIVGLTLASHPCAHASPTLAPSNNAHTPASAAARTPSTPVDAAERELFDLVNAERRRAGLTALRWYEPAAQVARAHSAEMRDRHVVAHESPTTGTPADRARRAGIHVPLVLENVGRAESVAALHDGLMHSPGHRANILNAEATHIGIGFALASAPPKELYVTQLFVRVLEPIDVEAARARVRAAIHERRQRQGAGVARTDALVDQSAQALAEALASHRGSLDAEQRKALLTPTLRRYKELHTEIGVVAEPLEIVTGGNVTSAATAIGVGIAQGTHPELGDNAIYVVVLLATKV